jgi:membrane protein required for colicin V production
VSLLDLIAFAILGFSIGAGFMAGFARAGIGFLAGMLGIVFGFWFYGTPAAWVHQYIHSIWASNLLGFLLVYWAFLLAGALIGRLLSKVFKWTGLSWLDRFMGAIFGLVRGALITVAFIAVLLAFAPKPMPNWMVDSKLLPYAVDASNVIAALAPNPIKDAFRTSMREIREIWEQQLHKGREELNSLKPGSQKKEKGH